MRRKTAERGYGAEHKREREKYRADVERGAEFCRRCSRWIPPAGIGQCPKCGKNHRGWDLGHADFDRGVWTGPEHVCCNRATAGRRFRVVAKRAEPKPLRRTSRDW